MATYFHDVPVTPHRIEPRTEKNLDFRNTWTYIWELPGNDTKGCCGAPLPIGCNQEYSIQTDGPLIIIATNDGVQWHKVMDIEGPGIYTIPMVVRAFKPIANKDRKTRVVVFLHAA